MRLLKWWHLLIYAMIGVVAMIVLSVVLFQNRGDRGEINRTVAPYEFDLVKWTISALQLKLDASLIDTPSLMGESDERQLVIDYLAQVAEVARLRNDLERVYATRKEATTEGKPIEQELADAHKQMAKLQPLAEDILQSQVSEIIAEEGFGLNNVVFPPVQMNMTELPTMLIVSPRDPIEQIYAFPLEHGLSAAEKDALETTVSADTNRSALVVDIGGLAMYPAMVIETADLSFLTDVIAHEWSHHWMAFRPIGYDYLNPNVRTINETVASLFGRTIGKKVMERYYAEPLPPPSTQSRSKVSAAENSPPPFDFRAEMNITRIKVDSLLGDGKIAEAEQYMEERRQLFVANGYLIRKLNQAYFAFHGAYADEPGATGEDPIGPKLIELWKRAPDIRTFMEWVSPINGLESLNAVYANQIEEK